MAPQSGISSYIVLSPRLAPSWTVSSSSGLDFVASPYYLTIPIYSSLKVIDTSMGQADRNKITNSIPSDILPLIRKKSERKTGGKINCWQIPPAFLTLTHSTHLSRRWFFFSRSILWLRSFSLGPSVVYKVFYRQYRGKCCLRSQRTNAKTFGNEGLEG